MKTAILALSENTMIPIGVAVAVIGGGAFWLSTIYFKQESALASITEIKQTQSTYASDIVEIKEELKGIHGELKRIK